MISLIFLNALVTAACITSSASSIAANTDGTVNSASVPCAGFVWQPRTWSNVDGRATSYNISRLVQFTPNNTSQYRTGNMASTAFNQAPDPAWPAWNTSFTFPMPRAEYSKAGNLRNSVCSLVNGVYVIKGMYKAFPKPFLNPNAPTLAEIDNYHYNVLMHLRRAFGLKTPTFPSGPYHLRAHWYSINNLLNPACVGKDGHCGDGVISATYTPDSMRTQQLNSMKSQTGYVCPDASALCSSTTQLRDTFGSSGGVVGSNNGKKITNQFQNALCYFLADGLNAAGEFQAHNGPIAGRPNFGVHINDKYTKVLWGGKSLTSAQYF